MHPSVLTLFLWYFLGSNPSLAAGNHWDYSAITSWRHDHHLFVDVTKANDDVDDYQIALHHEGDALVVDVAHQLNGYRVHFEEPAGTPDTFIPLIPHFIGRPWMDHWTVSSFMMDRYLVGAGIGPSDRVYVADVADDAGHKDRAIFFDKIGLRRLFVNHMDFSIIDVKYAYNPYQRMNRHNEEDPIGTFSHGGNHDGLGPDTTTVNDPPFWGDSFWDHGGVVAPHDPSEPAPSN